MLCIVLLDLRSTLPGDGERRAHHIRFKWRGVEWGAVESDGVVATVGVVA